MNLSLPKIEMQPVSSTNVVSIGYDEETSILAVLFTGGSATYYHYDYPLSGWEAFKAAPSKGGYYAKHIKGKYRIVKG